MLQHSSMVDTYYIKLFCLRTSRHKTMFLLLLVADTISPNKSYGGIFLIDLGNLNCGSFMSKYKSSPVIGLHQVLQIKNFQQYVKKLESLTQIKLLKDEHINRQHLVQRTLLSYMAQFPKRSYPFSVQVIPLLFAYNSIFNNRVSSLHEKKNINEIMKLLQHNHYHNTHFPY